MCSPSPRWASCGASKAALHGITRTWALELAKYGITVNAVAPGTVDTNFHRMFSTEQMLNAVRAATPAGRLGTSEESADVILCEDTRHTRKLLTHFGIERPLQSFHDHNEEEKAAAMADRIAAGETIALVSDAGTPVISDPGFRLVRLARERGLPVEVVPGPFAAVMALVASGIAPMPFSFYGFTPHRHGERTEFYRRVAAQRQTVLVYESLNKTNMS